MKGNYGKLIISIFIPLIVGAVAGLATSSNIKGWYQTLKKPSFAPPDYLFGPVWTALYIFMGIAFFLIWKNETKEHWKQKALIIFVIQLFLNLVWTFLFFYFKWKGIALFEIILLWATIFLTILVFAKISKTAAWLLVPYICWVSFASILNFAFWHLNSPNS
jgi:tryptophan-rich sensory protein